MRHTRWLAVSVVSLLLPTAFGCSRIVDKIAEKAAEKATEKAIEAQTGGKVDISKQGMTVEGNNGQTKVAFGEAAKLPDNFPKEVPIYPDAKITGSVAVNDKKKNGEMVMFETPDTPDKVADFYKSKLSGYASNMDMNTSGSRMLVMTSADGKLSVTIIASKSEKGSSVQLTAGQKSEAAEKP
jgi:hypothetical protein